jgi:CHAT domain-containing protein
MTEGRPNAGARALLVSHWAVYSEASVKLITWAMAETAKDTTIGRDKALRRAMQGLIETGHPLGAHPAFSAPFVVVDEDARR